MVHKTNIKVMLALAFGLVSCYFSRLEAAAMLPKNKVSYPLVDHTFYYLSSKILDHPWLGQINEK